MAQTAHGYGDHRWATYKQIQDMGGQVRNGREGDAHPILQVRRRAGAGGPPARRAGQADGEAREHRRPPMVRAYTVFNVEQADGLTLERRGDTEPPPEWQTHQTAELVIRERRGGRVACARRPAYYTLHDDRVTLPERDQFATANGYYQTALHELGHATGHASRLNRETLQTGAAKGFGSPEYARENCAPK